MSLKTWIAKKWANYRYHQIQKIVNNPIENQKKLLFHLLKQAENTDFAQKYHFSKIKTIKDFQDFVPITDYESLKPFIEKVYIEGKKNVLWKGLPAYFAKTSGTTSGTKFIPLSHEMMRCQVKGARDALLCYIYHSQKPNFLDGKMMFLSGSPILEKSPSGILTGRLSGISNHYVPSYLRTNQVPSYSTNCIEDWELKIQKIFEEVQNQDLRLISGIPPWVQMFFEYAEKKTGKKPIEIWKNLQIFVQGGVDFSPYRPIFEKSIGKSVDIVEVFPASEGFIAIQDDYKKNDLLLMLDYGIFYEFVPLEEYGKPNAQRLTLSDVELGVNYALILTTNAGLWAYDIGDTIQFSSLKPFRLRVTGRVKHFLSTFGEHIIQTEVNQAIQYACEKTGAMVHEFTVAPFVSSESSCHEWFIELEKNPDDYQKFQNFIDEKLQSLNIYYKDLRTGNILNKPKIHIVQLSTSREYMKSIGKLGGQNKFPRLMNNRKIADFMLNYVINSIQ